MIPTSIFYPLLSIAIGFTTISAAAQSFPIVPVSTPTYPADLPELKDVNWVDEFQGSLRRLGDINNDGLDDIVLIFIESDAAELTDSKAPWIYLQNDSGTFDQPYLLDITLNDTHTGFVFDFTIQDHNYDGFNDLVIATDTTTLPLLATPNGFVDGQPLIPSVTNYAPRLLYTDTDLDGDQDLVRWTPDSLNIEIWTNQGMEGYLKTNLSESGIENTSNENPDILFTDFDADGDLDILLIGSPHFYWMERTGLAYESPVEWMIETTNFKEYGIAAFADINADGLVDIVVNGEDAYGFYIAPFSQNETREISYYQFPEFVSYRSREIATGAPRERTVHSPGDLDGDGTDDLIVKPYQDSDFAFRITDIFNHNGRFGVSNDIDIHGDGMIEPNAQPDEQYNTTDIYFDINKDGALDRIVPASSHKDSPFNPDVPQHIANEGVMLWATLGNPFMPGTFLYEQDSIVARDAVHLTHADFDEDGEPEILLSDGNSIRTVRRNLDDRWDYSINDTRFSGSSSGFRSVVTQLDSDSHLEVISLGTRIESVIPSVYMNVEPGPFGVRQIIWSVNNNYSFDFLLQKLDIYIYTEDPSFAVGDIDADNDMDLLIKGLVSLDNGELNESVLVWLNDGEANFTPGPISLVEPYTNRINSIALIDHDHDNDQDLINIQGPAENGFPIIAIYQNDGAGNFTPALEIPTQNNRTLGMSQYWIEVKDLDLDGYDDIQVLLQDTNDQSDVVILYGSPTGISTEPVYITGNGAAELHSADLDGNGLPDLYTCSYQSSHLKKNSITVMFQISPREFLPSISVNDVNMSAVDALDMNRDGILDLISGGDSRDLHVIYSVPQPCRADIDLSKHTDFFDVSIFLRLFSEKRPLADFNNDGLHDFFDISEFISAFSDGC